jgi:hypothetical protein
MDEETEQENCIMDSTAVCIVFVRSNQGDKLKGKATGGQG